MRSCTFRVLSSPVIGWSITTPFPCRWHAQVSRQWARVLRHSGRRLASWLEAVAWERKSTGDLGACRRLYTRCIKEVEDFPEVRPGCLVIILLQWVPRVKSIRDSRAVKNRPCSAYTKNYIFPKTDKSNVQVRALVSACHGVPTVNGVPTVVLFYTWYPSLRRTLREGCCIK